MSIKTGTMEETSTKNAKISDSGYSNTCSNSQSNTSSGSSVSRNSNRSASSGYHGGNPSLFQSCKETLPKPITKRKDKGHKKKKSVPILTSAVVHLDALQNSTAISSVPTLVNNSLTALATEPCRPILEKKAEEVATVELVDATDPGVHNDNNNVAISAEAGLLASKTLPIDKSSSTSTEEYYAVISMHNGHVLHATPSLHASLGYPKDSWVGKLFIDFLDPRDKHVLTQRLASDMAQDLRSSGTSDRKASIFCRLRKYNAAQCTPGPGEKCSDSSSFVPYRINFIVQNFHGDKLPATQKHTTLLIASFQSVHPAYKVPDETILSTVFTMRHNASCRLSYVDPDVIQYLGYLPQDMIDRSLFDFYHPEDLPLIKDIYETVSLNPIVLVSA